MHHRLHGPGGVHGTSGITASGSGGMSGFGYEYDDEDISVSSDSDDSSVSVDVSHSLYQFLGVTDAILCLAACSQRLRLYPLGSNDGHVRHVNDSVFNKRNNAQDLLTLNVLMNLATRLSQDSLCDSDAFHALTLSINDSGGCHALWCYFQHWLTSTCVREMISIANCTRCVFVCVWLYVFVYCAFLYVFL